MGHIYEADPLQCAQCKGLMCVIALIEVPVVLRAILARLGRWQPKTVERASPVPAQARPEHANLPLTCHRVPEIA